MQDLTWIDITEQRIPQSYDNRPRSFLVTNRDYGHIIHVCWFFPGYKSAAGYEIRSYPHHRCLDTRIPITHWCIPSMYGKDWNDIYTLPHDVNSEFLVKYADDSIKHVYVSKNGGLRLKKSRKKLEGIIPMDWLNVPKFED